MQERDEEAREQLRRFGRVMATEDVGIDALYFAGKAYAELGMDVAAVRAFRRATDKWPNHPWSEGMREYLAERRTE